MIQARLTRYLTTEKRKKWKDNFKLFVKFYILLAAIRYCLWVFTIGREQSKWERQHPEPPDYSWLSKWWYRTARGKANPDDNALVPWLEVGDTLKKLIARLEDPEIDGHGVIPRLGEGEELYVEGIGKTGLDVTAKSETWRRGYYEALMGAAVAGEHLDTWVRDRTRNTAFPPDVVIGPSNPRPKPVTYRSKEAPKEEDCEPAFDEPQIYYMRIITTEGFSSRQRLNAALAYADFLQYKGLLSSASDMYDWALDIAVLNAPKDVIDRKSGIITDGATGITENVILAASALAMHKAQTGDLPGALPIYLSVLRARRSLPPADPTVFTKSTPFRKPSTTWYGKINDYFLPPPYPEAPPTGDEPATHTPTASCSEAATMAHIGEILYASSSDTSATSHNSSPITTKSQEAGLAWTRDAFDLAESTVQSMSHTEPGLSVTGGPNANRIHLQDPVAEEEAKTRCVECLAMAIGNWKAMLRPLREMERERKDQPVEQKHKSSWNWLWSSSSTTELVDESSKWETEEMIVAAREQELQKLLRREGIQMKEF